MRIARLCVTFLCMSKRTVPAPPPAWDMADRLRKALRVAKIGPGDTHQTTSSRLLRDSFDTGEQPMTWREW